MMNAIGRERGWSGIRRPDFDALRTLLGTEVAPVVREDVARRTSSVAPIGQPT
jgi:hypothetical protein